MNDNTRSGLIFGLILLVMGFIGGLNISQIIPLHNYHRVQEELKQKEFNSALVIGTQIQQFPKLVYLYGYPYFEFKLPSGYEIPSFVMPYSKENINAKYVISGVNISGDIMIDIPVSPDVPNISRGWNLKLEQVEDAGISFTDGATNGAVLTITAIKE